MTDVHGAERCGPVREELAPAVCATSALATRATNFRHPCAARRRASTQPSANMQPDLPEEFDVIVVGTGLTESLLAAACARAGQRVLHLDSNDHYGSRCSSFGLKQMDAWLRGPPVPPDDQSAAPAESTVPQPPPRIAVLTDAPTGVSFMPTGASAEGVPPADMLAQSHRYNIDLTPQMLLCAGDMVGVLRSSGVVVPVRLLLRSS